MIRNIVAFSALIVAGIGQANASTLTGNLFLQDYAPNGGATISSQFDPTSLGAFATAYDEFTLASTATVRNVSWQGGYLNPPTPSPISSFIITFYDSNGAGGLPGTVLATDTIAGNAGQTFIAGTGGASTGFVPQYTYDANIAPFTATAGHEYWMSIVAVMPYPPQWGWGAENSVTGTFASAFPSPPAFFPGELAFGLNSAVPEPATVTMSFIGVVGMVGFMLMRRRRIAVAA